MRALERKLDELEKRIAVAIPEPKVIWVEYVAPGADDAWIRSATSGGATVTRQDGEGMEAFKRRAEPLLMTGADVVVIWTGE